MIVIVYWSPERVTLRGSRSDWEAIRASLTDRSLRKLVDSVIAQPHDRIDVTTDAGKAEVLLRIGA